VGALARVCTGGVGSLAGAAVRLLPALAALALVLYPTRASAGAPTPLEAGEVAPFAGLLVEHGHAATLFRAEAQASRLRGELRGTKARLLRTEADLVAERQARQVDRDEAAERERGQAEALTRCEGIARESVRPASVWSSPILWGAVGVVVGVAIGVAAAEVL